MNNIQESVDFLSDNKKLVRLINKHEKNIYDSIDSLRTKLINKYKRKYIQIDVFGIYEQPAFIVHYGYADYKKGGVPNFDFLDIVYNYSTESFNIKKRHYSKYNEYCSDELIKDIKNTILKHISKR